MDLLSDLDPAQVEAVKQTEGPVLILAGAGSGKTRVLTYKVAYLISRGVDPNSILAVTFTNKAANEMKERVWKLVGGKMGKATPYVGTFHSFCSKLLRIDGKFLGIAPNYLIYDSDDSLSLVKILSTTLAAFSSIRLLSNNSLADFEETLVITDDIMLE